MSNIKTRYARRRSAEADREVDLVLAVMCCLLQPGQCVKRTVIAELTGMSHGGPYAIEQGALKKLRNRLRYTTDRSFGKEIAA